MWIFMRRVQMTIDEDLVVAVDEVVKKLKTTRSSFTREGPYGRQFISSKSGSRNSNIGKGMGENRSAKMNFLFGKRNVTYHGLKLPIDDLTPDL